MANYLKPRAQDNAKHVWPLIHVHIRPAHAGGAFLLPCILTGILTHIDFWGGLMA